MKSYGYKAGIALLAWVALAPVASATEPAIHPLKLNARYNIAWSGIILGRVNVTADESDTAYSLTADTKTRGIGAIISDERKVATARGLKKGADTYIPVRYESRPLDDAGGRDVAINYKPDGTVKDRSRLPEDDPAWRPPVTHAQIDTARDPITAAFVLRRAVYQALADKKYEVSTRTYDGARLAEMKFIRAADARVAVMGKYVQTVNLGVTRTPIAGYTPKELKKFKKGDPEIRLYFTNDAAFLPVRATASTPLGELSMTLVRNKPLAD
jgi:hypothetical protein